MRSYPNVYWFLIGCIVGYVLAAVLLGVLD